MLRKDQCSLLLVLGLAACGPAPVPIDSPSRTPSRTSAPMPTAGALPSGTEALPPGHPPLNAHELPGGESAGDVRFAGVVVLRGGLASREDGFVMISVKPKGIRMPSYSKKYSLSDAEPLADGERKLFFELDERDLMGGLVPGDLVLEVRFDVDGFVESKDDTVIEIVETAAGDTSAEIVLES